jgi:hypothetical protein
MAEVGEGSAEGNGAAQKGPSPDSGLENGSAGDAVSFLEKLRTKWEQSQDKILNSLETNIANGHLPTAKFFFDLIVRLEAMREGPESTHRSLAAVLWESVEEMEGKSEMAE